MANQALDRAVEVTRARMAAEGGLLATVALALIGAPAMVMQVVLGSMPRVEQLIGDQPVDLPQPTGLQTVAVLALILAQMLGQLTVARLLAVRGETVRQALDVAGRRFWSFVPAILMVGGGGTFALLLCALALGVLAALGGPGVLLAVLVFVALVGVLIVVVARLQLLVPQAVTSKDGPVALLRSTWRTSKGLIGSLVVLLIVIFLLAIVVPGAAQLLLGIPATLIGGPAAGVVAGAIGSGLVGSLVTLLSLSLAVAVHARSGADQGDVRGG